MRPLDPAALKTALAEIPEWQRDGDAIAAEYKFASYKDGLAFVNRIAEEADRRDHHPDIELGYRRVGVRLTSHDAGGVTSRDVDLARWIASVVASPK